MSKTYYAYQKTDDDKHAKLVSFGGGADGEQNLINLGVPTAEPQTQNTKKIIRNKNFPLLNNNRIYELCFSDFVTDKTRIVDDENNTAEIIKGFLSCDRFNTGDGAYCENSESEAVKMFYQFELIFDDSLTEQQKDALVFDALNGESSNGTNKIDDFDALTVNAKVDGNISSATFDLYYKKDSSNNRYLYTKTTNQTAFSNIYSMVFSPKLYALLGDSDITAVNIRGYEDNKTCIADPSTSPNINWAYVPCVLKVNDSLSSIFLNSYCFSVGDDNELILHKTYIDMGSKVESQLLVDEYEKPITHIDLTYILCDNYN